MRYTIITVNYNDLQGLRLTMASVARQTCRDREYIVIDGGSADGSAEYLSSHAEETDYCVSEPDRGIYHAMNKGVARASGDYCLFMNAGDTFCSDDVLERVTQTGSEADIIIGRVLAGDTGRLMSPPPARELTLYHLYSGAIPHQGAFIRTSLLRATPYDEQLRIASDWKFFVQTIIVGHCTVDYIDVLVARYDLGGLSSTHQQLMRQEKEQVLAALFPPRVLADYRLMKESECLTQTLTPQLRRHYTVDKLLFKLGSAMLKLIRK